MKTFVPIVLTVLSLFLLSSCQKNKPPVGEYWGVFTYESTPGLVKSGLIEIANPTKNAITLNGSQLSKDGKKIEGEIAYLPGVGTDIYLIGEWFNKLFSKEYKITGSFTQTFHQHGGTEYLSFGTFEIKSR